MEGVRVTGIDAQCSVQILWQYFDDTGAVVKAIYYPLLNNDAVVIFKHPSGTTDALTRNHKKWKVSPLPNQVFRRQRVWVESDLSMLVQATGAYQDALRNMGQVDLIVDSDSQELILSGQPYQIEWAWNYLSTLRDNQFHIARTLQTETVNYSSTGLSNGTPGVYSSAHRQSYQEIAQSPRSRRHDAELQNKENLSAGDISDVTSLRLENLTDRFRILSPTLSEQYEDVCHGGGVSETLQAEGGVGASRKHTSTFHEKPDSRHSSDARERRRRQDDANETFNKFASLPASNSASAYKDSMQLTDPGHRSTSSRRDVLASTLPGRIEDERLDTEHRLERQFQSLGFRDSGDDYHRATGGYQSLQTDFGRPRESVNAVEDRMRTSYTRERVTSASAHATATDSSLYALSASSAELAKKEFQLGETLKLKIYMDDITKTRTDAVVNAANWELKHLGGVAGALARAAGPEMAEECSRLLKKHGSLATAQVVKTKAYGKLAHLKYVLHTVGPIYIESDIERSVFELAQTFLNCLEFAEKLHLTSVTFPFISTGIFGMPVEHCVLALVTALMVFSDNQTPGGHSLREIHFINNDVNVVCEAIIMTEQRLAMENERTARDRLEDGMKRHGRFVYPYCQRISTGHYESERYATWDSSQLKLGAERSDRDQSRSVTRPSPRQPAGSGESWSPTQPSARSDARHRSSSLDRRNLTVTAGSSQSHSSQRTGGRDPSPRPQARPRSNSLTLAGKASSGGASARPSTSTSPSQHGAGGGGKQQPVIKKSLTGVPSKTTGLAKKLTAKKSSQSAGRSADYSGNETDSASAAGSEMDDADRGCTICMEPFRRPRKLSCGHTFCAVCIDHAFAIKPCCPRCKTWFTIPEGNQPKDGTMSHTYSQHSDLPGYEGSGTIVIKYVFPSGKQEVCHPSPGQPYEGIHRTAYLPDNVEGNEVLKLLKKAFGLHLVFTIGDRGVLTWNGITHKTSKTGGATKSGYPDSGYLKRVKEELADKGITSL